MFESASPSDREDVFAAAVRTCVALQDIDCAAHFANHRFLATVTPSVRRPLTSASAVLLWVYLTTATGNYREVDDLLGRGFPYALVDPVSRPVVFAELQLLAAQRFRRLSDFDASRESLDKALAATLSLTYESFDAPRLIIRIAYQFLDNGNTQRAAQLVAASMPLLQSVPKNAVLAYELRHLMIALLRYRGDFSGVAQGLKDNLQSLDRLQLTPDQTSAFRTTAYNDLLAAEVIRGDFVSARNLLKSHPLMEAKSAILSRGYFANLNEFSFALAEEFVRFASKDGSETEWDNLLVKLPSWTTDPERVQELQAFGQAAVGLRLTRMGKGKDGLQHFIEAARIRLAALLDRQRAAVDGAPPPFWADQLILQFAVEATLVSESPDYDLMLRANLVLGRTLEARPDDTLVNQALQDSDEGRRNVQTLRTIEYQRATWERAKLRALAERLLGSSKPSLDQERKDRLGILFTANDFLEVEQRIRAALDRKDGRPTIRPVPDVAGLKQLLLPDEALIFYVPALDNSIAKVCLRADQVLASKQKVDETFVSDARILRAALTATHPASVEADSQFPVGAALRLRGALFGGLERCVDASKRIYLVASGGAIEQVPPAVLLAARPPSLGSGFDLKAAHWMIRDHTFVKTSSISAFVAAKRLSRTKRASLDYLGVGDPVLASHDASSAAPGVFAARGSVPTQAGALTSLLELPETSSELDQVGRLFDLSKARTLRRESAREEDFRLQPLSEFDILHFATHGLIREELPGIKEPALVLTPDPAGDAFNDGLLTSSQIAALPFRARLVVLSACNSARYEASIIDDGIQGLSASFLIAGVPTMIASLWPIESSVTRDLIVATFREARGPDHMPIAEALAIAVRKHLDGPTPRPLLHPRFWAALTVLGDGSMRLSAPGPDAVRDLRAYLPPQSLKGDEVVSAVPSSDDFVSSTIGEWNGKRSPSLIRRQAPDGRPKWEVEDFDIGAGPISATNDSIYAGGYVSQLNGMVSVPVLRRLTPDGRVLWTRQLPADKSSMIKAVATAADGSALLLIGPSLGGETETALSLVRMDTAGAEVERKPLLISGDAQLQLYGSLKIDKAQSLAVINRGLHLEGKPERFNSMGMPQICLKGDAAIVVFLDTASLKETRRTQIDSFEASSTIRTKDGWLLIGKLRDTCRLETRAAAYAVKSDGSATEFWRDSSPFSTSAVAIRQADGDFEIIGRILRSIAIQEDKGQWAMPDFSKKRLGSEAHQSDEIFSVRLTDQGSERRRDFVAAGFPILPMGMALTSQHSVIYGSVGGRPLWLSR